MSHEARVVRDAVGGTEHVVVLRTLPDGKHEIVARLEGVADVATMAKARVMAAALDGRLTFGVDDWRKGDGEGGFERLGEAARATHLATLEASGSGCSLSVWPAAHVGDPDETCFSVTIERNAGALWVGIGPDGADALASVLIGPKGAVLQPATGDHGLLVLSADANGRFMDRVVRVGLADDAKVREAIGAEARPEAA